MRNKVKRTLSFLLTFVMLCSLLPMTAMAVPGDVTASKTAAYNKKTGEVTITMTVQGESVTQSTTREEKLPVFLYVLNQTDGETTADPADYSYLATGAKVKADTSMETPYTGKEAQNQIASWNVGGLGNHDGYAEVSSTPVGAESTWEMDENGNVTKFSFQIGDKTYTNADYDFTWQKLSYIDASYKENKDDTEWKPAFHLDGVLKKKPEVRTVEVKFVVDIQKGEFTEYGVGPVVFNIKENSSEKYLIPQITPNDGYEFTGWKILGNAEVSDGSLPKEMTEFELANVNKQIQYNGNEGSVTIEAMFSKKPVEKTLRIHWAIDNPEGAAWKLYEGNARTETIAWADRGNTFVMPELEIKDGYKLAGWSVSGTEDQYWDPETYEFGLTGLIVEDENGGQVSITANVVKDEEPVEKTLRIHWAIDNPEGAAWKLYEGNARTETIAWADRGNTFVMPELEIKDGYKLAGWSVSGTEDQYWDPETYEFGLTGLIVEDENGGQVSITANVVKDEEPVEKTLRIHWAIDNPEGAAWKLYEGNARTETIAWADRGNTFVMPELEIKDGYKLAGWSVSGTEGQYWDPETYEFGLTGLIAEDENGGQVSITANVVKDEEPAGKTLRIHWAIDNPEGAAWKLYEGNARTETIAWADRGNTFVMPELEIKDGYKLAGWSVSGTEGQYWDPETYEFGLTGLIVEDENGGQVSITANVVKDEEPAGKTLRIHWAIDNPEGAAWKLYEGNARTETIAWADRGNTFVMPELEIKDGYKLAGWSVSGTEGQYWDPETYEFGLTGLIVEDENGGQVSITANVVKDEEPAGKTLRIHWAIDNPEGAVWKLYEGNARTETIAWADRGNTFVMPELEIKDGYKLAGWSVSGTEGQYWDPETYEFGLTGLIVEDENGGQVSITANVVKDEEPAGKTLRIHWAIDNPEGAAWKLYEGNARTETIAWADRGNTFVMPELEIKDGYKLAGWSVSGTEGQYWDPETYEFGLTGLIVEDENGGQVSITANVVKDEEPTEDKIANVYFTVNPKYGYFKEYGEGPVSFENIDADSTQQFEVPEVVAKSGYKFVGWEGKGAGEIKWDANASTFGVPGLCYFPEGSNVGRADIRAVFEKEGGGHINDYAVTVIVDGKGEVKTKDYGTVGSNDTDVIWIPDFEDSVKFTMEPADGWKIDDVLVNGKSIGAEDSYVFETEDLMDGPELKVIFEKKSSGGGGGGSHDKDDDKDKDKAPDKTPDALNGEDHFNYIVGDADGKVHPERNITRAEVASIFFRLLKDDVRSENLTDQNPFADVFADDWFNVAVSTMYDMDIVFGRDNITLIPMRISLVQNLQPLQHVLTVKATAVKTCLPTLMVTGQQTRSIVQLKKAGSAVIPTALLVLTVTSLVRKQ